MCFTIAFTRRHSQCDRCGQCYIIGLGYRERQRFYLPLARPSLRRFRRVLRRVSELADVARCGRVLHVAGPRLGAGQRRRQRHGSERGLLALLRRRASVSGGLLLVGLV